MDRSGRVITARRFVGSKSRLPSRSDQSDWRRPARGEKGENKKEGNQQPYDQDSKSIRKWLILNFIIMLYYYYMLAVLDIFSISQNDFDSLNSSGFSGFFARIDPEAKFLENEQVEGVHLVTDLNLVRELHVRLGEFAKGPTDFFPALWPVTLSNENIHFLASDLYDVVPRANGIRYLLYVDSASQIYLENMSQHIFRVDPEHNIKMFSSNGLPITDTVLDGVFTREKCTGRGNSDGGSDGNENTGRLTFLIHDATRCNGVELTEFNIRERINIIQVEIMKQRLNKQITAEAFNLDIIDCKEAQSAKDFLSNGFQDLFKYSFRGLVFFPREKGYICGTCYDVFHWSETSNRTFNFRLNFPDTPGYYRKNKGELYAVGPRGNETLFDVIELTKEIRGLGGCIVECRFFNRQWVFVRKRNDRDHPNGKNAIDNKLEAQKNPITRERLLMTLEKLEGF